MARRTKQEYIRALTNAAKLYQTNLLGRQLLFVGRNNKTGEVMAFEALFRDVGFMHLTGLSVRGFSAADFFHACLNGTVPVKDLVVDGSKFVDEKFDALTPMMKLPWSARMMGDFNRTGLALYTEKIAGSERACMGFVRGDTEGPLFPNTVLSSDVRQLSSETYQVLAVYRKAEGEKLYPSEPTYIAKALISKKNCLVWPEEISCKIDVSASNDTPSP